MKICLCILLSFISTIGIAQNSIQKCGTTLPKDPAVLQKVLLPYSDDCFVLPDLDRWLQVYVHYITDSLGMTADPIVVANDLGAVNSFFEPIGLYFNICQEDTVPNFQLDDWESTIDEDIASALYYQPSVINVYITNRVTIEDVEFCGYAYFPGGLDLIVLDQSCLGDGKTWAHELGHFFGLFHTFEDEFGSELADGSNCVSAGDLICDTEADINIPGTVNGNCQHAGPPFSDGSGNFYTLPYDNIMSYHPADCICRFTREQYIKMADQYLNNRSYLW